jgi:HK97 family phage major capsid protein
VGRTERATERASDRVARVTAEARTYTERTAERDPDDTTGTTARSFYKDLFTSQRGDIGAQQRLQRHYTETLVERETRATTTGNLSGLVPPQYLTQLAILTSRTAAPLASYLAQMNPQPLPDQGMSLLIPKASTGVSAAIQATENSAVSSTDAAFSNITVPVVTLAGQLDVSRQAVERGASNLDSLIHKDLVGAYCSALETAIINSASSPTGIRSVSGVGQSTAMGAAITTTSFLTKLAGAVSSMLSLGSTGSLSAFTVHPRRWAWMLSQVDGQGRPIVVPTAGGNGSWNGAGIANPVPFPQDDVNGAAIPGYEFAGYMLGVPVIVSPAIPTTVGTASEDVVLAVSKDNCLLFTETPGELTPHSVNYEQTLGNQLTVKYVSYGFWAFTAERVPGASYIVGGNETAINRGLQAPSF